MRDVRVGERRGGRFHGGFAGATLTCGGDDAHLCRAETDQGDGRDREDDHDDHQPLTALVRHGAHSIRRAAVPSTTNCGRPMKPNGTGMRYRNRTRRSEPRGSVDRGGWLCPGSMVTLTRAAWSGATAAAAVPRMSPSS